MRLCDFCNKRLKRFNCFDIFLMELAVFSLTIFLFNIWKGFRIFTFSIHWGILLVVSLAIIIYLKVKLLKK